MFFHLSMLSEVLLLNVLRWIFMKFFWNFMINEVLSISVSFYQRATRSLRGSPLFWTLTHKVQLLEDIWIFGYNIYIYMIQHLQSHTLTHYIHTSNTYHIEIQISIIFFWLLKYMLHAIKVCETMVIPSQAIRRQVRPQDRRRRGPRLGRCRRAPLWLPQPRRLRRQRLRRLQRLWRGQRAGAVRPPEAWRDLLLRRRTVVDDGCRCIYLYIYTHTHTHIYIYILILKYVEWLGDEWCRSLRR